ncbi:MAG: hypothetical protein LUF91_06780 [Oscillospiraceae bacterium]|nr:hypothetical protein [Oscillospiraceae bacterium]
MKGSELKQEILRLEIENRELKNRLDSEKTAKYYAAVKTYVETCRKNGIDEMQALSRLCEGNPYTAEEIFA